MDKDPWSMFWRPVIFVFLVAAIVVSCQGCTGSKTKEAKLVDDMAENCRNGMRSADVAKEDDESRVHVDCAGKQ